MLNAESVLSRRRGAAELHNDCLFVKNEYELWAGNCLTLPVANQSCRMNNIMNGCCSQLYWPGELRDNNHHQLAGLVCPQ